ncbi:hypothetical protein V8C86DRAFT_2572194 [Haematococcus lacustris]|nr:hypothetical protein QJQ45_010426 [Haematococcus lacustris]
MSYLSQWIKRGPRVLKKPLLSLLHPQEPSRAEALAAIEEHTKLKGSRGLRGPRSGWQVKAAVWVKKMRVDRGTVHVARAVGPGHYQVDDSLRPRYVVPDLVNTQLKPYVTPYARDSLPSIVNESKSSS